MTMTEIKLNAQIKREAAVEAKAIARQERIKREYAQYVAEHTNSYSEYASVLDDYGFEERD